MQEIEQQIIDTTAGFVRNLMTAHWQDIREFMNAAPDSQVVIAFPVKINWQDAAPKVKTGISFAKRVTDECEVELNDPRQIQLPGTAPEELAGQAVAGEQGEAEPPHIESGTGEEQAPAPKRRGCKPKAEAEAA
jgi:RNase H-fold protein (predicted Holliday junction resolvase)